MIDYFSMPRAIIFDWDGTLIDSNDFKWGLSWQMVFEGEPEKQAAIKKIFADDELGRRYNRWELVRETLIRVGDKDDSLLAVGENLRSNPSITRYTEKFSEILETGLEYMQPFPNTKQTLAQLKKDNHLLYVISNTLTRNIIHAAKTFGLTDFFDGIYGLPENKYENYQKILQQLTDSPAEFLVVGDGEADKDLAKKIGCRFIGIANQYNRWRPDINNRECYVSDIKEVPVVCKL